MNRLPRLAFNVLEFPNGGNHHNLDRDHLTYCTLSTSAPIRSSANITPSSSSAWNSTAFHRNLLLQATARGSTTPRLPAARAPRKAPMEFFSGKLSPNCISPFKILAADPSTASDTSDGRPLHKKLLYLYEPPFRYAGKGLQTFSSTPLDATPCRNPDDTDGMLRCLPGGVTRYVLNSFNTKSPACHGVFDNISSALEDLEVGRSTGHHLVRDYCGGVIAVMYEAHWAGPPSRS